MLLVLPKPNSKSKSKSKIHLQSNDIIHPVCFKTVVNPDWVEMDVTIVHSVQGTAQNYAHCCKESCEHTCASRSQCDGSDLGGSEVMASGVIGLNLA